jgi:hypothetical protein
MPASVWLINLIIFGVLMESDLGRRKITWIRVLRPLISAAAIVPLFLDSVPTGGNNLALQAAGIAAGVILGLVCHRFVSVGFDPGKGKHGLAVSRAGVGYAVYWAVIFGARLGFVYASEHVFPGQLGRFMLTHQISAAGLTDALIFMALAMALARSALLARRARGASSQHRYQLQEA